MLNMKAKNGRDHESMIGCGMKEGIISISVRIPLLFQEYIIQRQPFIHNLMAGPAEPREEPQD